ncbi:MAG: DNA polymerase I [Bacteroidales bacterium]|nr:DNA polymerase I [Bacteroidales bacterium]
MDGKLFLIDGHALIFKMYYAFLRRPMVNSKGMDTSILFGFTKYLLEMIEREKPTHLAVAFDPPGGTFRNEMYPEYKANRPDTPQLIIDALEPLSEIVKAMNIPVLMIPGFEADDVIGSMALRSAGEGFDVYMVTPDKDYGQLVRPHVFQYRPGKAGGDDEVLDSAAVCAKYGIDSPLQVIDMLTICGDASDNVPGVKGVGEVGAAKLIAKYGSVEEIYAHLGELSARQQAMFEEARGHIALSKALVTIKTDIPLDCKAEDMRMDMAFNPVLADLFEKYEFNSLKRFISHLAQPESRPAASKELEITLVGIPELVAAARKAGRCSFVTEADGPGIFAALTGVTAAVSDGGRVTAASGGPLQFKELLEDPSVEKYGFGIKLQLSRLHFAGIELRGRLVDVELIHYILNPERSHSLDMLARSYLDITLDTPGEKAAEAGLLFGDEADDAAEGASADHSREAAVILLLGDKVLDELAASGMVKLYDDMEEPLIRVLARMERTGVKVDVASLNDFAAALRRSTQEREAQVRELAGEPGLNVSSPKQVGEVIFEKLKLDPKAKKSAKGSWSTDEETLLALADRSPIIDAILDYRATKKLLSTYIEPFPGYISPRDGRVHTTFNQALTATGRLSSSNPNLQNIPIRTERGKEIRKAFVAGTPGSLIMSADYSQIELRIMAHLSCDAHLVDAFRHGVDVHAATASKIFGIPLDEVTADQRRIAKTANFGIMYGISSFGLSQRLRCSRAEAKKIIDDYFTSFPSIRSFIDDTVAMARESGYVETLFGRRRYIADINSRNATVRALAERNAVNAPIQGTSADIIKLAMVAIDRRMQAEGFRSAMVLQIHDELLFEVVPDELESLTALVVKEMENVIKLSIPLTVECNHGTNWLESH